MVTRTPSRPSYSSRPSYYAPSPSRSRTRSSRSSSSSSSRFFHTYPMMYVPFYLYASNRHPHNCDTNQLVLQLSNGSVITNTTLINSIITDNSTLYGNITDGATIAMPCEKIKLSAVLGIALGIGIPVMLFVLCCCLCACCQNPRYKRMSSSAKHSDTVIDKKEQSLPVSDCTPYIRTYVSPQAPARQKHFEEFLFNSAYSRHVAKTFDNGCHITEETFEWLEYNQPELQRCVRLYRAEGMNERQIAIHVIQHLLSTQYITEAEKEKLKKFYAVDMAMVLPPQDHCVVSVV